MKENFRIIDDAELLEERGERRAAGQGAPAAQILRPARITPAGLRTPLRARGTDPFEYELLIPVDDEVDDVDGPAPTLDFIEIEEHDVVDESTRTTVQTPAYLPAQVRENHD